jgi:hypothetical protein
MLTGFRVIVQDQKWQHPNQHLRVQISFWAMPMRHTKHIPTTNHLLGQSNHHTRQLAQIAPKLSLPHPDYTQTVLQWRTRGSGGWGGFHGGKDDRDHALRTCPNNPTIFYYLGQYPTHHNLVQERVFAP